VTIVSLVLGGVFLLAMAGVAWYGAVTLPADARIPLHRGLGSYGNFSSKKAGLVAWPVGGAVVYGMLAGLTALPAMSRSKGGDSVLLVMMPVSLAIMLVAQWGAISVARRQSRPW
jgi:uncharacterized membrane protein (Fun14 family)